MQAGGLRDGAEAAQLSVLSLLAAAAVVHGGSAMALLQNQRPPSAAQ